MVTLRSHSRQGLAKSPFKHLDLKIRQKIWSYVVYDDDLYDPREDECIVVNVGVRAKPPAITRVCKQIRQEAFLQYLDNRFMVFLPIGGDSLNDLPSSHADRPAFLAEFIQAGVQWLNMIPKRYHQHVNHLFLKITGDRGMFDSKFDRGRKCGRLRQISAALHAKGYLSEPARIRGQLSISGQFHQQDADHRCIYDKLTEAAILLNATDLDVEIWECAGCGWLKSDHTPVHTTRIRANELGEAYEVVDEE